MDEQALLRIAVLCSVYGIIILFLVSIYFTVPKKDVFIAESGDYVMLKGTVVNSFSSNSSAVITVRPYDTISIFLFDTITNITGGNEVEVIGKIDTKDGKRSIIADKVRVIYT